jgi:hypothetical protein
VYQFGSVALIDVDHQPPNSSTSSQTCTDLDRRNKMLTTVPIDRLNHRGHVIAFLGELFLFKQRTTKARGATA